MTEGIDGLAAWPPAAVAAVAASALTLFGAVVGGCWAIVRWRRDVHREERDRAWTRIVWAIEMVCADDVGRNEIGQRAFEAAYNMQIARDADVEFVTIVQNLIERRREGERRWEP